jgi:glycine cleavage system aminomethyltransferase T
MARPTVKEQDFVGKEAYLRHREEEPAAILCTLTVDDHTSRSGVERFPLGREPITLRDGTPLTDAKGRRSYVTSAGAGPSVGKYILMAYLPPEQAVEGLTELAVEYMDERYPVTVDVVGSAPIFDPENARVRS